MRTEESLQSTEVLIVEDEIIIAQDLASRVEGLGCRVVGRERTGPAALQFLEERTCDLVLMDIVLSGDMDGIEAAEIVRSRFGIPVVFITAHADEERLSRAKLTLPFGYVTKPFQNRELRITIQMALYTAQAARERSRALRELEERAAVERQISRLAAGLVSGADMDEKINDLLELVGGHTGADRAYVFEMPAEGDGAVDIHEWCASGVTPRSSHPQSAALAVEMDWFREHLTSSEVFHLPDVSDLPDEALSLREHYAALGIRSLMAVPLRGRNGVGGFMGLDSVREPRVWEDETAALLAIAAEVVAGSLDRRRYEQELRDSEERFRIMFEHAPDAYYLNDLEGCFVDGNRAAEEMIGRRREGLIGRNFYDEGILPEEHLAEALEALEKNRRGEGTAPREFTLLRNDGEPVLAEVSTHTVRIKGRDLVLGIARDVTRRRRAEEELRRSERNLRFLTDHMLDMVALHKASGEYIYVSPSVERLLGWKPEELIGCSPYEFFHPDDREHIRTQSHEKVLENGDAVIETFEYRIRCKDGRYVWFDTSTRAVADETGEVVRLITVSRDATLRREAQQALEKSEAKFRSLAESSPDYIMRYDAAGRHTYMNPAALDAAGLAEEDALGRTHRELGFPEHLCGLWEEKIRRVFETGTPVGTQFEWESAWGLMVLDWRLTPEKDEHGAVKSVLGISRDVTEQQRTQRELQFQAMLLDQIEDWITATDLEGRITYVNDAVCRSLGRSREDLLGSSTDVYGDAPEEGASQEEIVKQTLARGEWRGEVVNYDHTGRGVLLDCRTRLVRDEAGRPIGMVGVSTDITERRRAEKTLQESEERFRLTFDTSPDAININRLHDGLYVDINEGFTKLTGFTREDAIGRSSLEIDIWHDPADRDELVRGLRAQGYYENLEARFRRKDGSLTTALMSARLINLGGAPHIISITRDISHYKETQEELWAAEHRFRTLIENAPLGIITVDPQGEIQDINTKLVEILGSPSVEATRSINMFTFPPLVEAGVADRFQECIRTGAGGIFDTPYTSKWGKQVHLRYHLQPLRDPDGGIVAAQGIIEDVSVFRTQEEQLRQAQKMEAVGTLAGGIAHDFNNLLQAVGGYTHLLLWDKAPGDPQYNELKAIETAVERAAALVRQLLTFSRKVEGERQAVDMNREVQHAEAVLSRTLPRMIDIRLHLDETLGQVMADPVQIEQILLNLGVNAADAMPDGGELLLETREVFLDEEYCRTHLEAKPGRYVQLTVSDTGHGIPDEIRDNIFDPFFTTKEVGKGTGLGLASVFGIVKSHGGYVTCDSEAGRGASFNVYLPLASSDAEIVGAGPDAPEPVGGSETILVVDDEEPILDFSSRALSRFGYTVLTARSGEEALAVYRSRAKEIDLVIMDLSMPGMGGANCLDELIRFDPDARVIISSGYSADGKVRTCLQSGAAGYIAKPYQAAEVLSSIRSVLDRAD